MTLRYENRVKTYDTLTVLSYDHNYVTANLTGKDADGATGNYVDLGGEGYTEGKVVFNITSMAKGVAGVFFTLELQGGKAATFVSHVPLARLDLGFSGLGSVRPYATLSNIQPISGRYVVPFCNDYGGELYRYLKVVVRSTVTASISTGIQFESFISK